MWIKCYLGRKCKQNFLATYLQYTTRREPPELFHMWAAVAAIAAALERNVWIPRADERIFPNLYVILVGGSAAARKSTAINIAQSIIVGANIEAHLLPQKLTAESLIHSLSGQYHRTGSATGYILSSEMSVLLHNVEAGLIQVLTDLYDCRDHWDYETIKRGVEPAHFSCCNMFAATTPSWLQMALPQAAIGGGFTSRIIFVYQHKTDRVEPHPQLTPEELVWRGELFHDLSMIRGMIGVYKMSPDAYDWFAEWYIKLRKSDLYESDNLLSGYIGRKHTTLLKVSMCMAAGEGDTKTIEVKHMDTALNLLNMTEGFVDEVYKHIQTTPAGTSANKVLDAIKKVKEISHSQLLRRMYYYLNAHDMAGVLDTLVGSGTVEKYAKGNTFFYKLGK